ncbi:MAG: hypothetical protein WBE50_10145 [Methyloceanibacter sp.]
MSPLRKSSERKLMTTFGPQFLTGTLSRREPATSMRPVLEKVHGDRHEV